MANNKEADMHVVWIIVGVLLTGKIAWAEQVSFIEHHQAADNHKVQMVLDKKLKVSHVPIPNDPIKMHIDHEFEQMKDFMQQEDERLKAIKILNLDLERANLELKKKEVESKLAVLNQDHVFLPEALKLPSSSLQPMVFKVNGVFLTEKIRLAMININGTSTQVAEGQLMREGVLVKRINPEAVTLEYPDGKQEILSVGL